jgi:uncharacterized membrane protein
MTYILFALVVILQPVAQILEKYGMSQIGRIESVNLSLVPKLLFNPFVVGGVALSFVGLAIWLVLLSRANVSYLYPFGAVSYIILAILANRLLGEPLGFTQGLGIGVIVVGAILLNIK